MERELRQLKELIKNKIHHSFLLQHIEEPKINDCKLYFLNHILNKSTLAPETKEQLIITSMLVQIALDIHEQVPDSNKLDNSPSIGVDSQLAILAGDYYSGLYYWLLSEIEEREFIKLLATTIKQINELKMELYFLENGTIDQFLTYHKQIGSLLITNLARYFGLENFTPIMEEVLLTDIIINGSIDGLLLQDKEKVLGIQINKTNDMIDNLKNESLMHGIADLFHSMVYQHTSSELD
ncbi:heptaprenyl diphosphate synthase component 1 [Ornithinibacillus scapharcae]|uniref:heptaprenyl diphosphate synthase component 1 n=1 Tax=Ornithinibacillus scapharcae TaxID=1147159 RepID=UPI000225BB8F|nr:heptaprenyl diphosphate synthase component 1 [Ornithinibacillus scapharcae]